MEKIIVNGQEMISKKSTFPICVRYARPFHEQKLRKSVQGSANEPLTVGSLKSSTSRKQVYNFSSSEWVTVPQEGRW